MNTDLLSLAKTLGAKNLTNNAFSSSPITQQYLSARQGAQNAEAQLQATKTPLGALSSGIALYMQRKNERNQLEELNKQYEAQKLQEQQQKEALINYLPEQDRPLANFLDRAGLQQFVANKLKPSNNVELPANAREFEYFDKLSPERQKQYIDVKRADPYQSAYNRQIGKDTATAQVNLGGTLDKSDYLTQKVDELIQHPGFSDSVGFKRGGAALQNFGIDVTIPGTKAADFKSRLDQIGGASFLQAYDTLKGGGQITEVEGEKATSAISRMKTATSEKEFLSAADDFKNLIDKAKRRAIMQSGSQFGQPLSQNNEQPSGNKQQLFNKYGLQ